MWTPKKKSKSKSIPVLTKLAQFSFNAYIRNRDSSNGFFRCISCGQIKPVLQMNAGHYFSVGGYSGLRFDEANCHGQCIRCNMHLSGNLIEYRRGLVERYGEEFVQKLELKSRMRYKKHARCDLEYIIDYYKQKTKDGQ